VSAYLPHSTKTQRRQQAPEIFRDAAL